MMAPTISLEARRSPYTPGMAAESHMEAAEAARRLLGFSEDELRSSFERGDVRRLRTLQRVHADVLTILSEHRRQAGWFDALCADGRRSPGHGRAA